MKRRILAQNGSMSLTALISVSGGVLFAMAFANLVRYVSVENALEQAMQRIARCIDPTDAACTHTEAPSADQDFDWYLDSRGQAVTSWADEFNYNARLYRQDWSLSFPAFEIHKVILPPVTWKTWQLPLRSFTAELNSFERRSAHISATFDPKGLSYYTPLANPNFPEFDPGYERDLRDGDPALWGPRALNVPGDVRRAPGSGPYVSHPIVLPMGATWSSPIMLLSDDSRQPIPPGNDLDPKGSIAEFVTGWFEVPALYPPGSPAPECRLDGRPCDPAALSVATGGDLNWADYAYVAVKAFAVAERVSGSPQIKWAGSEPIPGTPDGWGLQLETVTPAAWQRATAGADAAGLPHTTISIPNDAFECLGGREWSDVESKNSWKNFHLVLRGAVRRHPGDNSLDNDDSVDPACPRRDRTHWGLWVQRGGAYRIRGWLKVRGGTVRAQTMIEHYFDNYRRVDSPTEPLVCDSTVQLLNEPGRDTPPTCAQACQSILTNDYKPEPKTCAVTSVIEPACSAAPDNTTFPVTPIGCASFSAASCTGDTPVADSLCAAALTANPKRIACMTENTGSAASVTIAAQNFPCPQAVAGEESAGCDDGRADVTYNPNGNYGDPAACPSAERTTAQLMLVRNVFSTGAPIAVAPPAFQWGAASEYVPSKWTRSLFPKDETGQSLSDPQVIRPTEAVLQNTSPIFVRSAGDWSPPLTSFPLSGEELAALSSSKDYSLAPGEQKPFEVTSIYPFARRPEFQIPDFLPTVQSLASCSGAPVSLEDRLRAYASHEIPEAADPAVTFEASAEYVDSAPAGVSGGCGSGGGVTASLPQCTKISFSEKENVSCGVPSYLGRYSAADYPNGPEACHAAEAVCYSTSPLQATPEAPLGLEVNLTLAREHGYREVERALPGSKRGCDGDGCASFEIDTSKSPETTITARYQMPLSFPLDLLFAKSALAVEKSKSDVQELAIAGRITGEE